jgi:hypothetical protein
VNYPEDLRGVAKRVIWFEEPEEALKYRKRFLTYLMTYGSDADVEVARHYYADADFEATLDDPVPGIFDAGSWRKWNTRYHRIPVPPLPKRVLPGERPSEVRGSLFQPGR